MVNERLSSCSISRFPPTSFVCHHCLPDRSTLDEDSRRDCFNIAESLDRLAGEDLSGFSEHSFDVIRVASKSSNSTATSGIYAKKRGNQCHLSLKHLHWLSLISES